MTDLRHAFTGSTGVYAATGCFVALEGGEGAGKSTQAAAAARLARGRGVRRRADPRAGGHRGRRKLRRRSCSTRPPARSRTAPRRCSTPPTRPSTSTGWSRPRWPAGAVVVTDRYVDSTLAYQGAGRDLVDREVERVARWATADLRPHLTVRARPAAAAGADPLRGARPDRGRVGGVPRAGARDVPAARRRLARALPRRRRPPPGRRDRRRDPGPAAPAARPGGPPARPTGSTRTEPTHDGAADRAPRPGVWSTPGRPAARHRDRSSAPSPATA